MAASLLDLSFARVLAVVFYPPQAHFAILVALLGLALGGIFSYTVAGRKAPLFSSLGRLSLLAAILIIPALAAVLAQGGPSSGSGFALVCLAACLPFAGAGAIFSLLIAEAIQHADRVYAFALGGAAAGCLLLPPLLKLVGGPDTAIAAAVTFAVAAAIWQSLAGSASGRAGSVAVALALVTFLVYNHRLPVLTVRHSKGREMSAAEIFSKWNGISRVGIEPDAGGKLSIAIDGQLSTPIARFDLANLSERDRRDLTLQGPGLAYALRPGAKTLVVGSGGGWDLARALYSGSGDVTAVEPNPIVADTIMRERYAALSNGLYLEPEVHVRVEDPRAFLRRDAAKYRVLQITLADSRTPAAGGLALSRSELYTSDAFRDYLGHLTSGGILSVTRWGFDPPRESLRVISLAIDALTQLGEKDAWRHIVVSRQEVAPGDPALDTVLIARKPFEPADIARAHSVFATGAQRALYYPGSAIPNPFRDLLLSPNPAAFERGYAFDITPVTDDRPFFFYLVQPRDIVASFGGRAGRETGAAIPLLFGPMGIAVVATTLILLIPPPPFQTRLAAHSDLRGFQVYFLFTSAGYTLVASGLIQKLVLFLGHSTYSLTGVIVALLISSGVGSFHGGHFLGQDEGRLIKALGLIALLATLLALVLSALLPAVGWLPLALRLALAVVLIAPLGFVMGMPLPAGLKRLEAWHGASVRWACALYAASGVLGSAASLVCGLYLGFAQTAVAGAVCYLGALAIVARGRPADAPPVPGPGRVVLAR
jgi:hypothetical protein